MATKRHLSLNKPVAESYNLFNIYYLLLLQHFKGLNIEETTIQLFNQNCISQLNLSLIFIQAPLVVELIVFKLNKRNGERFSNRD